MRGGSAGGITIEENGGSLPDLRQLRAAIRKNLVTFPREVPVFSKAPRPEIQWRIAVLFFVRGWSCPDIGRRYGFRKQRAQQIISKWAERAVRLGYIQPIAQK
jgi:hypothetical protein